MSSSFSGSPFIVCSKCKSKMTRRGFAMHNYLSHDGDAKAIELNVMVNL